MRRRGDGIKVRKEKAKENEISCRGVAWTDPKRRIGRRIEATDQSRISFREGGWGWLRVAHFDHNARSLGDNAEINGLRRLFLSIRRLLNLLAFSDRREHHGGGSSVKDEMEKGIHVTSERV